MEKFVSDPAIEEAIEKAASLIGKALQKGGKAIGMTRKGNNRLSELADVLIAVDHDGFSDRILLAIKCHFILRTSRHAE